MVRCANFECAMWGAEEACADEDCEYFVEASEWAQLPENVALEGKLSRARHAKEN